MHLKLIAALVFAALLCGSASATAQVIGRAQTFAIVGEAIHANGVVSTIRGNIGSPAGNASITGFPLHAIVLLPFSNLGASQATLDARTDLLTLYLSAVMAPGGATDIGVSVGLAGLVDDLSVGSSTGIAGHYTPGRYTNAAGGVALLTTSITLDTPGTYVFTVPNALTAAGTVILGAGVDPCAVWWRTGAGAQATINGASFSGTVVSDGTIAVGTAVALAGRTLTTATGQVTLAGGDTVGSCSGASGGSPVTPTLAKAFTPTDANTGQVSTVSITLTNTNAVAAMLIAPLVDTLPTGVVIAASPNASTTCFGAVVANPGGSFVRLTEGTTIAAGSSCIVVVNVTAATRGTYTNTMAGDSLQTSLGTYALPTSAILAVSIPAVPALSHWAILVLALLLCLSGLFAFRPRPTS